MGACFVSTQKSIHIGHSFAKDSQAAVKELYDAIHQPNLELVLFFCSSHYDLDALALEMNTLFPKVRVIGCTTAGEIGPGGYTEFSLSGVSFSADSFTVAAGCIHDLHHINNEKGHVLVNSMLQHIETRTHRANSENSFAFMLIDGLSLREEPAVRILQNALGDIPLFGGSAGDDLRLKKTWVFFDGAFHSDSIAFVVVHTIFPFKLFKAQHFIIGDERLVVTKADPSQRIVYELNGYPAAEEYARMVHSSVDKLNPKQFSATPLIIRINGLVYVRSIQTANPDGSLTFYCAIDNGLVLMLSHGIDLVKNLEDTIQDIQAEIGKPQLILGCECILRNLEIKSEGLIAEVENIFINNNVVGFSTYGEQYLGVHINQTITGVAIGQLRNDNRD
jgi:hypothetical protein